MPVEELSRRAGRYRDVRSGVPLHLEVAEGKLQVAGWTALIPTSPLEFRADAEDPRGNGGSRVVFEDPSSCRGPGFRVVEDGGRERRYERVEAFAPSQSELRAFEGEYYGPDAETTLSVSLKDGKLVVHRRPDWTATLAPEYADAFDAPDLGLIRFHRDRAGRVTELGVSQPRVYDMRFRRVGDVKVRQTEGR